MKKSVLLIIASLLAGHAFAASSTYTIDPSHSFANYSIRHVVSKATGTFNDVSGTVELDPANLSSAKVKAVINVASINTGLAKRDEHVKADKYLDAAKYTQITFESTKVSAKSNTEGLMTGNLTLHGVTKEITIPVKVLGFGTDPWGGNRAGFEGAIKLKASDFGLGWATGSNAPLGDDVDVTLLIEGIKK